MPYQYERKKKKIPRALDRRVKITAAVRREVISLYQRGVSQRGIARQLGISRRAVSFIIDPEKLERCREQYKERRQDGRYYIRKKHTMTMRRHRRYKQSIKNRLIDGVAGRTRRSK